MSIIVMTLSDRWGRDVLAQLIVRRDTVELRCRQALVGICDRDRFRRWLSNPSGLFSYDETTWLATGPCGGLSLAVDDDVPCWPLQDLTVQGIRDAV